jgi:hypothetical protein
MIAVKSREFDAQLLAGIRTGLQKARELGYHVERMDVTASIADGVCSVHFAPVSTPGTIVTGGDLSLTVESQTQEVTSVLRGQ